jgi:hypothetical protein
LLEFYSTEAQGHIILTICELDKGRTIVEVGTGIRKANSRAGKKKSN